MKHKWYDQVIVVKMNKSYLRGLFIAVKRHHDHATGLTYSFRGLVHDNHGRKHDVIQADMVLKKLRIEHLHQQAVKGDYKPHWA